MWQLGYAICQKPEKNTALSMPGRFIANLLVCFLSLWAIYTIVSSFVGVTVYFPFNLATDQDIPYHRWQSVRLALFATFAFYGFMHLLHGSREVYPVHFLKTYLFMLSFVAAGIFLQEGVHALEYSLIGLFLWVAITLHFATGTRLKRYFSKK